MVENSTNHHNSEKKKNVFGGVMVITQVFQLILLRSIPSSYSAKSLTPDEKKR